MSADYLKHESEGGRQRKGDFAHDEAGKEVIDKGSHGNLWQHSSNHTLNMQCKGDARHTKDIKKESLTMHVNLPVEPSLSAAASSCFASCQGWSSAAPEPPWLLISSGRHLYPERYMCRCVEANSHYGRAYKGRRRTLQL